MKSYATRDLAKGGAMLVAAAALAGLAVSLYLYLAPLTGVNGTLGALLVAVASAALVVDGLCLAFVWSRAARLVWYVLGFLGAILTLAAAYFLHAWLLMAAMIVVLVALVFTAINAGPPTLDEVI